MTCPRPQSKSVAEVGAKPSSHIFKALVPASHPSIQVGWPLKGAALSGARYHGKEHTNLNRTKKHCPWSLMGAVANPPQIGLEQAKAGETRWCGKRDPPHPTLIELQYGKLNSFHSRGIQSGLNEAPKTQSRTPSHDGVPHTLCPNSSSSRKRGLPCGT